MDKFDLEQQLLKCWGIIDDIDLIASGVMNDGWTQDQIVNALIGIKEIYDKRFDILWNNIENGI